MARLRSEELCFTFLWKLENISYCLQKTGRRIESPAFVVDEIENAKWRLWLYPRGEDNEDYIGCYLYRGTDKVRKEEIEIIFQITFVSKDGKTIESHREKKHSFSMQIAYGYPAFHKRKDVFFFRSSTFLPEDTLRVRCRIWKSVGEMTEAVRCIACTRIGVQKRSFVWNVKNFSSLQLKTNSYKFKFADTDKQLMSADLFLTGGFGSKAIFRVKLSVQDQRVKFSTFHLSIGKSSGIQVEFDPREVWFHDGSEPEEFKYVFRDQLLTPKDLCLPDDILPLHCKWAFSEGVISEKIEEIQQVCTSSEREFSDAEMDYENTMSLSYDLNMNLKSLCDENFLCDVQLKTETLRFNAHKIILSAASSVFKSMFSSNMKEKESNCVDIVDLTNDTLSRMLHYIYTTRVEGLTWEVAFNLYLAADKYAILSLKNLCTIYLKCNLTTRNACKILLLSDLTADSDLKFSVQGYIFRHIKDVVNSEEWKLLMETNAKLAAETICLQYK